MLGSLVASYLTFPPTGPYSEHQRRLITPDECRVLDDHAAIVLVKGPYAFQARKFGSPSPQVIDLASPRLNVAAIATGFLLAASVSTFALWPSSTPPPALSATSSTEQRPAVQPTPTPETPTSAWQRAMRTPPE